MQRLRLTDLPETVRNDLAQLQADIDKARPALQLHATPDDVWALNRGNLLHARQRSSSLHPSGRTISSELVLTGTGERESVEHMVLIVDEQHDTVRLIPRCLEWFERNHRSVTAYRDLLDRVIGFHAISITDAISDEEALLLTDVQMQGMLIDTAGPTDVHSSLRSRGYSNTISAEIRSAVLDHGNIHGGTPVEVWLEFEFAGVPQNSIPFHFASENDARSFVDNVMTSARDGIDFSMGVVPYRTALLKIFHPLLEEEVIAHMKSARPWAENMPTAHNG